MTETIKLNENLFIDKTAVLYGLTGTGKSTVILHILSLLQNSIEQVAVFAGNEDCASAYKKVIPSPLIFLGLNVEVLKLIWERQDALHVAAVKANKVEVLSSLFNRLNIKDDDLAKLKESYCKILQNINEGTKKMAIVKKYDEVRAAIYKKYINQNIGQLLEKDLSPEESHALKYNNLNPKILIVMDDVASNLGEIKKLLEQIFFQGRHRSITLLLSVQDDKKISSELRKNAFVNIFTSRTSAASVFMRASNNFSKEIQARAELAIRDTFAGKYQTLLHIRMGDKFYKFVSPLDLPNFTFGSAAIKAFCDKIKKNQDEFDNTNPFSKLFNSS